MEVTETNTTGTTDTSTNTEAGSTQAGTEEGVLSDVSGEQQAGLGSPPPAWTPSYEFTVKDKKHQFDDWIKPVIKTKDDEKRVRDLYEKAFGLDAVKSDRESLKTKISSIEQEHGALVSSLREVSQLVQKKDFASFFEALKIPKEDVIRYAIEELKFADLPAEEQAAIQNQRSERQRLSQIEQQNSYLQQQYADLVRQQGEMELSSALGKSDVQGIALAFDERAGKPGAFREEVIKRGRYYEVTENKSIPVEQAVQEVIALMGTVVTPAANTQQATSGQMLPQGKKPVIPVISGGSGASPTKKVISSIEDLKRIRQERALDA